MADRYETSIDRQLREATERGDFDNLPGAGKPLPDHGREYEEDWWVLPPLVPDEVVAAWRARR